MKHISNERTLIGDPVEILEEILHGIRKLVFTPRPIATLHPLVRPDRLHRRHQLLVQVHQSPRVNPAHEVSGLLDGLVVERHLQGFHGLGDGLQGGDDVLEDGGLELAAVLAGEASAVDDSHLVTAATGELNEINLLNRINCLAALETCLIPFS